MAAVRRGVLKVPPPLRRALPRDSSLPFSPPPLRFRGWSRQIPAAGRSPALGSRTWSLNSQGRAPGLGAQDPGGPPCARGMLEMVKKGFLVVVGETFGSEKIAR